MHIYIDLYNLITEILFKCMNEKWIIPLKKKNVNVDRYIMRTSHFLQMKFYAKVCMRYKIIKIYSFQIIKMHSVLLKGTFLFKILTKESFLFIFVASLLGKTTNIYGYRYIYMCLSS